MSACVLEDESTDACLWLPPAGHPAASNSSQVRPEEGAGEGGKGRVGGRCHYSL